MDLGFSGGTYQGPGLVPGGHASVGTAKVSWACAIHWNLVLLKFQGNKPLPKTLALLMKFFKEPMSEKIPQAYELTDAVTVRCICASLHAIVSGWSPDLDMKKNVKHQILCTYTSVKTKFL